MVRRPETPGVRVQHLGSAGSAPADLRPRRARRPQRRHLAARDAQRSLAVSRPMRRDLGLDPPERRIGLSAHDFAQALGAPEVILARAAKVAGAPTVTSRFVQRIAALAGEARWDAALTRGKSYLELARALDHPAEVKSAERPAPKPQARGAAAAAVGHRHRGLAARSLHHLRQIYSPPAAARCGRHAAGRARPRHRHPRRHRRLHRNVRRQAAGRSDEGTAGARRKAFRARSPIIRKRAPSGGRAICASRNGSRNGTVRGAPTSKALYAEISGELKFPVGQREFTLSAIADRIERRNDGSYAILDYKTGAARTEKQVRTGLAPQLTLEAAILRGGGFKTVARRLGVRNRLRDAERRRAGRQTERRSTSRTARPTARPTTRWRS